MSLVAEVRARLAAAAPGPWEIGEYDRWDKEIPITQPCAWVDNDDVDREEAAANAALIAAAPTDLARLCDRVEELERALREDLNYHAEQAALWSCPDFGDNEHEQHHQRRADILRAALGETPP